MNILFLSILLAISFPPKKLVKTNLTPGVSMLLPEDFSPIPEAVLAQRFFSDRKPTAFYTDPSGQIEAGVNFTRRRWNATDLQLLKDLYRGSLRSNYSKTEFMQEQIRTIQKRTYIVFEFVGTVTDADPKKPEAASGPALEKYNYLMYTVVEGEIVLVSFVCPGRLKREWQSTVQEMMNSVKIKNLKLDKPKD